VAFMGRSSPCKYKLVKFDLKKKLSSRMLEA